MKSYKAPKPRATTGEQLYIERNDRAMAAYKWLVKRWGGPDAAEFDKLPAIILIAGMRHETWRRIGGTEVYELIETMEREFT